MLQISKVYKKIILPLIVLALLILALTLSLSVYVKSHSEPYIITDLKNLPHADAILVLGASVYPDGTLTTILKDRVDKALSLYEGGNAPVILVSGDNGDRSYNEVVPVRGYLEAKGVPEKDIVLDYAGFSTYDSMYRARDVFGVKKMTIVTQAFHLPRAIWIARELHIDARGVTADTEIIDSKNSVREIFATVKAFLQVAIGSQPKFLGKKMPLNGTTEINLINSQ